MTTSYGTVDCIRFACLPASPEASPPLESGRLVKSSAGTSRLGKPIMPPSQSRSLHLQKRERSPNNLFPVICILQSRRLGEPSFPRTWPRISWSAGLVSPRRFLAALRSGTHFFPPVAGGPTGTALCSRAGWSDPLNRRFSLGTGWQLPPWLSFGG